MKTTVSDRLFNIIVLVLFGLGLFNVAYTFTGVYAPYGNYYSALNVFLIILLFTALSGIWSREKWGLWMFPAVLLLKIGIDLYAGAFHMAELLLILPVLFFFSYRSRFV
jgi:hypothetical protein